MTIKYRIVQFFPELGFVQHETEDVISFMEVRGKNPAGVEKNCIRRAELQNQPIFPGFFGPMWDGDAVRYEDQKAYTILGT